MTDGARDYLASFRRAGERGESMIHRVTVAGGPLLGTACGRTFSLLEQLRIYPPDSAHYQRCAPCAGSRP